MRFSSLRNTATAAATFTSLFATASLAASQSGQSTFTAIDSALTFGLTIPNGTSTSDLYFSIAAPVDVSWAAVGLGNTEMKNTLVLMIYQSGDGKSTTLSPRISTDTIEPKYNSSIEIEKIESKVENGTMFYSGKCENCRSWSSGQIDVASGTVKGIWAVGPGGSVSSNAKDAPTRYHVAYGALTMDVKTATGSADAPVISLGDANSGAQSAGETETGKRDWKSTLHALAMIFTFIGLMPLGLLILRVGSSVRWHWINQSIAAFGVIIGTGLGVYDSFMYQRSRGFNTAHQILGLVTFIFVVSQWILGFQHHRIYKRTQQTTKLAPIHVWLGRSLMTMAVVTAFLGFPLAQTPNRNYILAGLVVAVFLAMTALLFFKNAVGRLLGRRKQEEVPRGYDPEPWRHVETQRGNPSMPYEDTGYNTASSRGQAVGLTDMGSSSEYVGMRKDGGLGGERTPREYV